MILKERRSEELLHELLLFEVLEGPLAFFREAVKFFTCFFGSLIKLFSSFFPFFGCEKNTCDPTGNSTCEDCNEDLAWIFHSLFFN